MKNLNTGNIIQEFLLWSTDREFLNTNYCLTFNLLWPERRVKIRINWCEQNLNKWQIRRKTICHFLFEASTPSWPWAELKVIHSPTHVNKLAWLDEDGVPGVDSGPDRTGSDSEISVWNDPRHWFVLVSLQWRWKVDTSHSRYIKLLKWSFNWSYTDSTCFTAKLIITAVCLSSLRTDIQLYNSCCCSCRPPVSSLLLVFLNFMSRIWKTQPLVKLQQLLRHLYREQSLPQPAGKHLCGCFSEVSSCERRFVSLIQAQAETVFHHRQQTPGLRAASSGGLVH